MCTSACSRSTNPVGARYLGPELGKWYAEHNPSTEASVTVTLQTEHCRTHDFGKALA